MSCLYCIAQCINTFFYAFFFVITAWTFILDGVSMVLSGKAQISTTFFSKFGILPEKVNFLIFCMFLGQTGS